ncbi:hypothetical protein DNTS_016124 [Danionella cerebrum]|uniref:Uncharacterized protein n=1 Tax=Danionella cerebrum TaxID=2873325 RepID=A0A553Q8R0_9TELE|nr:hypothetical protein DNTS_016124 [Danionella translucida]
MFKVQRLTEVSRSNAGVLLIEYLEANTMQYLIADSKLLDDVCDWMNEPQTEKARFGSHSSDQIRTETLPLGHAGWFFENGSETMLYADKRFVHFNFHCWDSPAPHSSNITDGWMIPRTMRLFPCETSQTAVSASETWCFCYRDAFVHKDVVWFFQHAFEQSMASLSALTSDAGGAFKIKI